MGVEGAREATGLAAGPSRIALGSVGGFDGGVAAGAGEEATALISVGKAVALTEAGVSSMIGSGIL